MISRRLKSLTENFQSNWDFYLTIITIIVGILAILADFLGVSIGVPSIAGLLAIMAGSLLGLRGSVKKIETSANEKRKQIQLSAKYNLQIETILAQADKDIWIIVRQADVLEKSFTTHLHEKLRQKCSIKIIFCSVDDVRTTLLLREVQGNLDDRQARQEIFLENVKNTEKYWKNFIIGELLSTKRSFEKFEGER